MVEHHRKQHTYGDGTELAAQTQATATAASQADDSAVNNGHGAGQDQGRNRTARLQCTLNYVLWLLLDTPSDAVDWI